MARIDGKHCETCRWFNEIGAGYEKDECRKRAPMQDTQAGPKEVFQVINFAKVSRRDWCGDYEQR